MIELKNNWLKIPIILYVVGFVVHNTYLSQFGSYEFELVQAKYIFSGFGVIAFCAISLAYISIGVNLSTLYKSFHIDKLLPWLLRVSSFPYIIYEFLQPDLLPKNFFFILLFLIANYIVAFSVLDLIFIWTKGNNIIAKINRSFLRILSIPFLVSTIYFSLENKIFLDVIKVSTFLFFGLIGLALSQEDKELGIERNYLDENTKTEHQDLFTIFFGVVAIGFMFANFVILYVNTIYPKIPVGLGGAKIELVEIYIDNSSQISKLIQETDNWILYINQKTKNIEKVKTDSVNKIIYMSNKNIDKTK